MTELELLEGQVRQARFAYERRLGAARELGTRGVAVEAEVARLTDEAARHERVTALLTSLGEQAQASAQAQLEQLVTRGLQVIFGSELSFHVEQDVKANQSVINFVIRSSYAAPDGTVRTVDTPVMDARGGGMAAVVGFMIRLVVLLLTPGARRVLFLDETFAHLSKDYEPRLAEFLAEVARKAQVQIVLVTHSDAYMDHADAHVQIRQSEAGITEVTGDRPGARPGIVMHEG